MRADTAAGRGALPFIFGSMRKGAGVDELVSFLKREGGLASFS
jgi:Ni2+-binding GTPase involved in maturation of urease and hydrogenase